MKTEIVIGDITTLDVDAIVNAANTTLLGGGGVDGAIHRAAGPELLEHCQTLHGTEVGTVKRTPGFNLPAKYILHAVGPNWEQAKNKTEAAAQLQNCYKQALQLCEQHKIKTVAFPAISTGIYGYPMLEATEIATTMVRSWTGFYPEKVIFCCFTVEDAATYRRFVNNATFMQRLLWGDFTSDDDMLSAFEWEYDLNLFKTSAWEGLGMSRGEFDRIQKTIRAHRVGVLRAIAEERRRAFDTKVVDLVLQQGRRK